MLQLEEKVREWQESPMSSLNVWYNLQKNWMDVVVQALKFLAGDLIGKIYLLQHAYISWDSEVGV